jgi:FixJ family two-component response regulator
MRLASTFVSAAKVSGMPQTIPVVFVVDDDASVRESLEMLIPCGGWAVETFATAEEFLARQRPRTPSCLILDLDLPDINVLDVQKQIAEDGSIISIVFLTDHADVPAVVQAMKSGAVECLTKPFVNGVLLSAIEEALARSRTVLADEAQRRLLRCHYDSLSKREREIMGLVVQGLLNKCVGGELGISEITVKAHRGKVMRKMRAHSLAELVIMAARLELRTGAERSVQLARRETRTGMSDQRASPSSYSGALVST